MLSLHAPPSQVVALYTSVTFIHDGTLPSPTRAAPQVIALYTSPQAFDANARDHTTISGICDNPQALKRLAKDTLTALDHLHKYVGTPWQDIDRVYVLELWGAETCQHADDGLLGHF